MQAVQYTDKSIAVFGDTKPWAGNLRELGGKFNGKLRNGTGSAPGWIFPMKLQGEVMQFIAQANSGMIQPTAPNYGQNQFQAQLPTQMAPFGQTQPAMTPQTAMAQLATAQVAYPRVTIPFPQVAIPQTQTAPGAIPFPQVNIQQPQTTHIALPQAHKPLLPAPVNVFPAPPIKVNFPHMFTAADGLLYQIIIYAVIVPVVGQRVTLVIGNNNLDYTVSALQTNSPSDDILIRQVIPENADPAIEPAISRAVVMCGKWQIPALQEEHSLTFHSPE